MAKENLKLPRRRKHKEFPSERAILGVVRKLMDPETGEEFKCITPAYAPDRKAMNECKLAIGEILVMDWYVERNRKFWRLWHALGGFVAENHEEFNGLTHHDCLKKIQLGARVHCELADFVLEDGTTMRHWTTKSFNFRDVSETMAGEIWERICDYVAETFFPDWTPDQVNDAAAMWQDKTT